MKEWAHVNQSSLQRVTKGDDRVRLEFTLTAADTLDELKRLVSAEDHCCGPASVRFDLEEGEDSAQVIVSITKDGLPAQTVLAAFASMGSKAGAANQ